MKILSVNAGSSSLKFTAFEMPEEKILASGYFERIGISDSFYTIKMNGEKIEKKVDLPDHTTAFKILMQELIDLKIVSNCCVISFIFILSLESILFWSDNT